MPVADRAQLVELAGIAVDVDRDDRLRSLGHGRLDRGRVEVVGVRVDVGEDGRRSLVHRAVRRRDERVRRRDHLVAGAHAGEMHAEMKAGCPRRDRSAIRRAGGVGEHLLEPGPHRAEREPPGPKHLEHELLVPLVDPRRRERDTGCGRARGHTERVMLGTSSRHCGKRSLAPRTVSRYAFWIWRVMSPTPISWSSTDRSGVTSAAVPHMNTSSAR